MRDDDFYRELSEADSEDLEKYLKDLAKLKKIREEEMRGKGHTLCFLSIQEVTDKVPGNFLRSQQEMKLIQANDLT